jgi:UDP-N-acetylmuramoyl-tripeptide--D-alanyl-D-alanine ligase
MRYLAAASLSAAVFFVLISFYHTHGGQGFVTASLVCVLTGNLAVSAWQFFTKKKKPLVFTPRVIRLLVTQSIIAVLLMIIGVVSGRAIGGGFEYIFVPVAFFFVPQLSFAAVLINRPIEEAIAQGYIRRTEQFFANRKDLIKIGITGSYGKTSVKFILQTMMSKKYKTVCTPGSFNTPMGMSRSSQLVMPDTEVFIAEMGARYRGNIAELARIVKPNYAILTAVAGQHLETMGSIENIYKTKYELVEALPKNGFCVFNGDNAYTVKMSKSCECEPALASLKEGDCIATDISVNEHGSSFTLSIGGESVRAKTGLVGKHNILNISMAAALSYKLGVSLKQIAAACEELEPVPHRLQVLRQPTGVTVIDDSFNGSRESILAGLETLAMFKGRKFFVTPGVVELGDAAEKVHLELGGVAAKVCDFAFFIGGNAEYLKAGMLSGGARDEHAIVCGSLNEAQELFKQMLAAGDTILLANDLPDNY